MKPVDRYIRDVMRDVFAPPEDRQRLEADLRAHFAEAESRGEPASQIIEEMGPPADVARAFNAEREIDYAGFWQRLVAFVGDCGLLSALALPPLSIAVFLGQTWAERGGPEVVIFISHVLLALTITGIVVFYFPILEARFGKTFGKHLLRLRVLREDGAPIGLGQAFVRRLSLYFKMLWVDALFIPFTDKRQRALDIVAKTVVAREQGEPAPVWAWLACLLLPVVVVFVLLGIVALCAQA